MTSSQNIGRKIISAAVRRLKRVANSFKKNETIQESKNKWDDLAKKNAKYFIMSDYGEDISDERFRDTGKTDVETLVLSDSTITLLQPFADKTLLEIGCGTGRLTEFIAAKFKNVIGVDISNEMITEGKKRLSHLGNITLFATDGVSYPVTDNTVDCVFSFIVFQHMPTPEIVRKNIEEIARVLKTGGIAKIQLRGIPTEKGQWYYGPSFTCADLPTLVDGLPLIIIKTSGEHTRYFWVYLKKS